MAVPFAGHLPNPLLYANHQHQLQIQTQQMQQQLQAQTATMQQHMAAAQQFLQSTVANVLPRAPLRDPPYKPSIAPRVDRRPTGIDLEALTVTGRCKFQSKAGVSCQRTATYHRQDCFSVCKTHKTQKMRVGVCKAVVKGRQCGLTFKWKPPYNELCREHEKHKMPCHFLKLPTELRLMILQYLLPNQPVPSAGVNPLRSDRIKSTLGLLRVNKQLCSDATEIIYGQTPFFVRVTTSGVKLCGHDFMGAVATHDPWNPHMMMSMTSFFNNFQIQRVRKLCIQITMEKRPSSHNPRRADTQKWDDEIEVYLLRDVVKEFVCSLSTCNRLQQLKVLVTFENFAWKDANSMGHERALKLLIDPFTAVLSNIPSPHLYDIHHHSVGHLSPRESYYTYPSLDPEWNAHKLSSTALKDRWESALKLKRDDRSPLDCDGEKRSQAATLYQTMHQLHDQIVASSYHNKLPRGRYSFMHRARVAREANDAHRIAVLYTELKAGAEECMEREQRKLDYKKQLVRNQFVDPWAGGEIKKEDRPGDRSANPLLLLD
ncbi:hypothetical protein K402DRAFT_416204 [Aulographum hederae CBS 113979]|uniref:F-box domain-containing protein n=1 Tax=Aulographum hederae CBS 113979 TaxID=1176131 RepID=A0A6G1HHJ6_9PEZI|nr:hypothetical protein K402DRAFT_416204 [Aulographum hederae CBS 113979]